MSALISIHQEAENTQFEEIRPDKTKMFFKMWTVKSCF